MSNARTLANTINSSSQIVVPSGGVNFGTDTDGTGTFTGGILDDYEEGTWTPICENSSGTQTTMGSGVGKYTKIGDLVFLSFGNKTDHGQSLTAGSNSGFYIQNFPFTQAGGGSYNFSSSSLVNFADTNSSYSLFNLNARSSTGSNNFVAVYNKSSVDFNTGDPLQFFHVIRTS